MRICMFRFMTLLLSVGMILFQGDMYRSYNSLLVLIILLFENIIVSFMQRKHLTTAETAIIWLVETAGIGFILSITGGIFSPYFWLIINPMLLGFFTSKEANYFQHLVIVGMILLLFKNSHGSFFESSSIQQIYFLLGIVIIVIYSLLITSNYNIQNAINRSLIKDKKHIQKTLEVNEKFNTNIVNALEFLEKIEFMTDYEALLELFLSYIKEMLKAESYFIANENGILDYSHQIQEEEAVFIADKYINANLFFEQDIRYFVLDFEEELVLAKVEYRQHNLYFGYKLFGNDPFLESLATKFLTYMMKLYRLGILKINNDQLKKEISVKDEQNRIAEEMHDNVNQDLFAIGCQLFNLRKEVEHDAPKEKLLEKINKTYILVDRTTKDLKRIINNMSIKKNTGALVIKDIENYLDEMGEIFNIKIETHLDAEISYCDLTVQNLIFRILNESISNAVRHGHCKWMSIAIQKEGDSIAMVIKDDGKGIQANSLNEKTRGLGIFNLEKIAKGRGGTFSLTNNAMGTGVILSISFGIGS